MTTDGTVSGTYTITFPTTPYSSYYGQYPSASFEVTLEPNKTYNFSYEYAVHSGSSTMNHTLSVAGANGTATLTFRNPSGYYLVALQQESRFAIGACT